MRDNNNENESSISDRLATDSEDDSSENSDQSTLSSIDNEEDKLQLGDHTNDYIDDVGNRSSNVEIKEEKHWDGVDKVKKIQDRWSSFIEDLKDYNKEILPHHLKKLQNRIFALEYKLIKIDESYQIDGSAQLANEQLVTNLEAISIIKTKNNTYEIGFSNNERRYQRYSIDRDIGSRLFTLAERIEYSAKIEDLEKLHEIMPKVDQIIRDQGGLTKFHNNVSPKDVIDQCGDYIIKNSIGVIAFKANFLALNIEENVRKKLSSTYFQNIHEQETKKDSKKSYTSPRLKIENELFDTFLKKDNQKIFKTECQYRGRYGACILLDKKSTRLTYTDSYGKSFIALSPTFVRNNAIFIAGDSISTHARDDSVELNIQSATWPYQPCTMAYLPILLNQMADHTLRAIITATFTGQLNSDYNQKHSKQETGGYIEIQIPPVSFNDKNAIAHLHISPEDNDKWFYTKKEICELDRLDVRSSYGNHHLCEKTFIENIKARNMDAYFQFSEFDKEFEEKGIDEYIPKREFTNEEKKKILDKYTFIEEKSELNRDIDNKNNPSLKQTKRFGWTRGKKACWFGVSAIAIDALVESFVFTALHVCGNNAFDWKKDMIPFNISKGDSLVDHGNPIGITIGYGIVIVALIMSLTYGCSCCAKSKYIDNQIDENISRLDIRK